MDRPVLIDQVVVIFVIRIKILKLPFIQIDSGGELPALRFEIGHGGGTGKWNRHGIVALVNQFEGCLLYTSYDAFTENPIREDSERIYVVARERGKKEEER